MKEPIKYLGISLSNKHDSNDNLNFFVKIYKMDTKLNIWQTRDLTLTGRQLKPWPGLIQISSCSLCVPKMVIKMVQEKKNEILVEKQI